MPTPLTLLESRDRRWASNSQRRSFCSAGGPAPITEALIKIVVLKARQGALSEDKAFELLGALRLL